MLGHHLHYDVSTEKCWTKKKSNEEKNLRYQSLLYGNSHAKHGKCVRKIYDFHGKMNKCEVSRSNVKRVEAKNQTTFKTACCSEAIHLCECKWRKSRAKEVIYHSSMEIVFTRRLLCKQIHKLKDKQSTKFMLRSALLSWAPHRHRHLMTLSSQCKRERWRKTNTTDGCWHSETI